MSSSQRSSITGPQFPATRDATMTLIAHGENLKKLSSRKDRYDQLMANTVAKEQGSDELPSESDSDSHAMFQQQMTFDDQAFAETMKQQEESFHERRRVRTDTFGKSWTSEVEEHHAKMQKRREDFESWKSDPKRFEEWMSKRQAKSLESSIQEREEAGEKYKTEKAAVEMEGDKISTSIPSTGPSRKLFETVSKLQKAVMDRCERLMTQHVDETSQSEAEEE